MITDSQNSALKTVAQAALIEPRWGLYGQYCLLREQGLRKQAFIMLDKFLISSREWNFEAQKSFVIFLLKLCDAILDADYGPFPEPLQRNLVKPVLIKWCEVEKIDSTPFRWYGKYFSDEGFILNAIKINPNDDEARSLIVYKLLANIDYATHHLPDYYIGEPALAFEWEREVNEHLSFLVSEVTRTYWVNELKSAMLLVNDYVEWQVSGHPDFELWGQENNKNVNSGVITVYYKE